MRNDYDRLPRPKQFYLEFNFNRNTKEIYIDSIVKSDTM